MKICHVVAARSRAQTIWRLIHGALPIHFFCPLSTQVSPSRFAVVVRPPPVPEPTRGSVRPKAPIFSSRAIGGSHFSRCSSEPPSYNEPIAKPLRTPKNVREEARARAIYLLTRALREQSPTQP